MRSPICSLILGTLLFLLTELGCCCPALADRIHLLPPLTISQQSLAETAPLESSPSVPGLTDPKEFEAFLDEYLPSQMAALNVPGTVISVVKDGKLFFTKGYGHADLEKQTPVDPEKTLFRVGSVSKLVTTTAIMQLVDRGLLDLDADVNQYLPNFQIDRSYLKAVTVGSLLTHTSGFSQQYIGIAARSEAEMTPLADYVAARQPFRARPPGMLYSYTNYDADLAGYLVEAVSGVPFAQYIEKNILRPLKINRSTFLQPLPPNLASDLATGYEYKNGSYQPAPFLYLNAVPAGAMSATATDMAHFMLAHLQNGRYGDRRILSQASTQAMQQQHYTDHPKLPGVCYGFHERFRNNQRILAHSAIFYGYTGLLALIPEQKLGLFIAYNRFMPKLHEQFVNQLIDRYYPAPEKPTPQPIANAQVRSRRFVGTYRNVEYSHHTLSKLASLLKQVSVGADENGILEVDFPPGFFVTLPPQDDPTHLIEVEPLLFYRTSDDDYVAFSIDEHDRITYMFHPLDLGPASFERLHWDETSDFQFVAMSFFLVMFVSAVIVSPIGHRLRRSHAKLQSTHLAQWAWLVAGLVGTLNLAFLLGLSLTLWLSGPTGLVYGLSPLTIAFLYLPLFMTGLAVSLPVFTLLAWRSKTWSLWKRVHYSLITIAAFGFIWFLDYWNLLGFRF
jgi:CubicO group peptidase (beta-lactamase class C family)